MTTPTIKSANTIIKPLWVPVLVIMLLFSITSYLLSKELIFAYSAFSGTCFSYLGFRHLVETQQLILQKQKKAIVFIRFISRLIIYAAPVILGLKYTTIFHIFTIIFFLFTFQLSYIIIELIQNYKSYKKRLCDG